MIKTKTKKNRFAWADEYLVGLEEIDAQHHHFMELIRRLDAIGHMQLGEGDSQELLKEIDKYAYFHFQSEEALMTIYEYPNVERQKREHFKLLQTLDKKICDFRRDAEPVSRLAEFIASWFLGHLDKEDRSMAEWIREARHCD